MKVPGRLFYRARPSGQRGRTVRPFV